MTNGHGIAIMEDRCQALPATSLPSPLSLPLKQVSRSPQAHPSPTGTKHKSCGAGSERRPPLRVKHSMGGGVALSTGRNRRPIGGPLLPHVTFSKSHDCISCQPPLSMEYWSGLPYPSPEDLPDSGIKSGSLALQVDSLLSEPPVKPKTCFSSVQSLSSVRLFATP